MADAIVLPRDYYVYILYREDGVTPFYVGKGKGDRWLAHELNVRRGRSHKDNIIAGMKDAGIVVPKKKIAKGLTNREALALEVKTIDEIGRTRDGGPLTNLTAGGDGAPDLSPEAKERHRKNTGAAQLGKKHSEERRARLSAILKGRQCAPPPTPEVTAKRIASLKSSWAQMAPEDRAKRGMRGKSHSEETKSLMREKALGRVISAEQRAHISACNKARKVSLETKARMAEAQLRRWAAIPPEDRPAGTRTGMKHSEESKALMRENALGKVISPEQRAAISAAQKGRTQSPETRAKRSEALRRSWQLRKAGELENG